MDNLYENIFEPLKIGNLELKNRIMMAPMEVGMGKEGGVVSDRFIEYMKERAKNDVAILITGSVGVSPEGRGLATQLSCYDDRFIPGLKALTDGVHEVGGKIGAQIYHAGRQASEDITGLQPIAPSPIPCAVMNSNPREMTEQDIDEITNKFIEGAKRLEKAGFDLIEVHLAHGYLLHSFLSPFSNKRQDQYGGSLENRLRFPRKVVKSILEEVNVPVTIRISADEFLDDGLKFEEVVEICKVLQQDGICAISISAGSYASLPRVIQPMMIDRGFLIPYAEKMKSTFDIPIIVAGRINTPELVAEIINNNKANMVALGRGLISDPEFLTKIKQGQQDHIAKCIACNQGCIDQVFLGKHATCLVNPRAGNEIDVKLTKADTKKKVVVIGGGPAGLSAAKTCADRGHEVVLIERQQQLGGKIPLASASPGKDDFSLVGEYYIGEVERSNNITIKTSADATAELIKNESPDVLIIATGSIQLVPKIEGINADNVINAEEVLQSQDFKNQEVIMLGGGLVGCDTALALAERGCKVKIVEMLDELARDVGPIVKMVIMHEIEEAGIEVFTKTKVVKITDKGVVAEQSGQQKEITGQKVVIAAGYRTNQDELDKLKDIVPEQYVIGDAFEVRKAIDAIGDGFFKSLEI